MKTYEHPELRKLGACREGVEFASQFATLTEAWSACNNPSQMMWFARNKNIDKKTSVRIAIFCARLVLPIHQIKYPDDKRPLAAIEAAEGWLKSSTREVIKSAAYAASDAAKAASDAAKAASDAAYAAADAAAKKQICDFIRSVCNPFAEA